MKKQVNAPTYGWESAAVRAALERKGWLWVSIEMGAGARGTKVAAWYPPRVACFILAKLREAGSCSPVKEWWAYRVEVAGPGQPKGYFNHYNMSNLTTLLWGLHFYHRKVARNLKRELARNKNNILDSKILGRTFEYTVQGQHLVKRMDKPRLGK